MQTTTALLVGGVLGAVLVGASLLAWRLSERVAPGPAAEPPSDETVPPGVAAVLSVLRSSAVVLGSDGAVVRASAPAYRLGLVEGDRLQSRELADLVRASRRDGGIREVDLDLSVGSRVRSVAARVAPLGAALTLVLVEDRTRERRVETIRRDFVANVSHELKTPIGAIQLLAEAVAQAADDPAAVRRFAGRMTDEGERLQRLVQQILALSRLQGDDPIESGVEVSLDDVAERALARVRVEAERRGVGVRLVSADSGVTPVVGDLDQLVAAVGNLAENAVAYSAAGSTVTISVTREGERAAVSVADRGTGIPAAEVDRIFERFYRVDPARARDTGGTGLGLSIVKHVAATHGGEVRVWSVEGEGSTFTLLLPPAPVPPRERESRAHATSAEIS